MSHAETLAEIKAWSTEDRLILLDELWTSLDQDDVVEITPGVRALLDERIAHANAHPDDVLTWDEMKADLGWK